MSIIEEIDRWTAAAEAAGIEIRYENFGGTGGGLCEYQGKRWLFIDLALSAGEQLERIRSELNGLLAEGCDPLAA